MVNDSSFAAFKAAPGNEPPNGWADYNACMLDFFESSFPKAPTSLIREAAIRRRFWSGNENVPGCPIFFGWTVRVSGHTVPVEKAWLRANGFQFHGGVWGRQDDVPAVKEGA